VFVIAVHQQLKQVHLILAVAVAVVAQDFPQLAVQVL
jgi:hypothetical protein